MVVCLQALMLGIEEQLRKDKQMNEQDLIQFLILRNESLAEELGRIKGIAQATIRGQQALNETINDVLGKDIADDEEDEEEDCAGESVLDSIAEAFRILFGQKQEE